MSNKIPDVWLFNKHLGLKDIARLQYLWWYYNEAYLKSIDKDLLRCFSLTQKELCSVLDFSETSRTKVTTLLTKLEDFGFIYRIKEEGPKHYIIVLNPVSDHYTNQIKALEDFKNDNK